MKLVGGWLRDNMSTKDAVGNGNAAMKEAAMQSLGAEAADSAAREWTDPRMQGQETLAGSGIVTVRAGSTAGLKAGSPIACHMACGDGGVLRS